MIRDNFENYCLRAEMRAERKERLARERDYRETGYLGDYLGGDDYDAPSAELRDALDWAYVACDGDVLPAGDALTHGEVSAVGDELFRYGLRLVREDDRLVARKIRLSHARPALPESSQTK